MILYTKVDNMPLRNYTSLHPSGEVIYDNVIEEEEEEGGEYLFNPEAGRASDNPFAHHASKDAPDDSAASDKEVSKYVKGEEE